jgi:TolB-like protein/DNA-binding winged helix-turn-helix (wHTH) protein/tetratricopeptide (TPR) repeat protein
VSRTLLQNGVRLHLPARLFDALLYLVQHHDRLVERDELSRAIWSGHTVSEGSLGRAISSLRLSLKGAGEDGLIVTAPGRGYRFGAPVRWEPVSLPIPTGHEPGLAAGTAPQNGISQTASRTRRLIWTVVTGVVLAVSLFATLSMWRPPGTSSGGAITDFAPPPHSVAVLPFANHGTNVEDTLYADGIAQELINALGRIGGLRVAASTSSFLFRSQHTTIGSIARQLNVGTVLEGSVQQAGERIHITVELIDARNGFQLWSRDYDRSRDDVLATQGEISAAVVISLKGVLLGDEATRLTLGSTSNSAAFDAYLHGVAEMQALDPAANRRAIADFNQAVLLDPKYALAYAHRARALAFIGTFGNSPDLDYSHRVMTAAQEDARHAVELAPDLGAVHADLAYVLQTSLADLQGAEIEYRRAIALTSGDAPTLLNYGRFLLEIGHTQEGVDAAERAVQLDPLAASAHGNMAIILEYARHFDEARQALQHAMVLRPASTTFRRITLGMLETMQGHGKAAREICEGDVDYRDMMCLAIAYHLLGRQSDAANELAKARAILGINGAFLYARIYAEWGQPDEAFQWLQTAYDARDPGLIELKVDPAMDTLRSSPKYNALIRKMGFPPA